MLTLVASPDDRRNENAETSRTNQLVRDTNTVMRACGIPIGPSKVARLVHRYVAQVEHNGYTFADYMINQLVLTTVQHAIVADELTKITAYADPTGEQATSNVIDERGF